MATLKCTANLSVSAAAAALSIPIVLASAPLGAQTLALPRAEVEYDHGVDFKPFRTFQWKENQDRLSDPVRHTNVVTAIERELQKKGLKKPAEGEEGPDLRVRFYTSVENRIRGTGRQSQVPQTWSHDLRTSVDLEKMAEGTLVIELYQAGTGACIWRGTTTRVFRPGSLDESAIRSAVAVVLRAYPPAPASSPAP